MRRRRVVPYLAEYRDVNTHWLARGASTLLGSPGTHRSPETPVNLPHFLILRRSPTRCGKRNHRMAGTDDRAWGPPWDLPSTLTTPNRLSYIRRLHRTNHRQSPQSFR